MTERDYDDYEAPVPTFGRESVLLSVPVDISELKEGIAQKASNTLCVQLRDEVLKATRKAADEAIAEVVSGWAEKIVREEIAKPRAKTNNYGREIGETQTIDEIALEATTKYMTAEVNERGDFPGYNDKRKTTRLQFLIGQAIGSTVEKVAKEEVGKAMAELRLTLATAAQKEMGEAVLKLLGVK
jgi:hypothetical protein